MRAFIVKYASFANATALALLLAVPVMAQDMSITKSSALPILKSTPDLMAEPINPPAKKPVCSGWDANICVPGGDDVPDDDDHPPVANCPPGWRPTLSGGCRHAPGSIPCGDDGRRCDEGNICADGNTCLPRTSSRVCSNGSYCGQGTMCTSDNHHCIPEGSVVCVDGTYCPASTICTPPGQTVCLRPDSPRICPNKLNYCLDADEVCFRDNTCWRPSGNGLIGGTNWVVGYNERNTDPRIVKKAKARLREQFKLAGEEYSEAIDFQKYQFILGIGVTAEKWYTVQGWAEGWRTIRDHLSSGQYSVEEQGLYNSLRGRAFGELGCHSNGAMVCLAALENKDVRAERVVLYGPDITPESLEQWSSLIKTGRIKTVQIYINKNDPIPGFTLIAELLVKDIATGSKVAALLKLALLNHDVAATAIRVIAPDIDVITLDNCDEPRPSTKCHALIKYE